MVGQVISFVISFCRKLSGRHCRSEIQLTAVLTKNEPGFPWS